MTTNSKKRISGESNQKKSILEKWERISKEYVGGELNEQEKAQFDRARFAEEQARNKSFVLGGHINQLV